MVNFFYLCAKFKFITMSFKKLIDDSGVPDVRFQEWFNCSYRTWKKRYENPGTLTVDELEILSKHLNLSVSHILLAILDKPKN